MKLTGEEYKSQVEFDDRRKLTYCCRRIDEIGKEDYLPGENPVSLEPFSGQTLLVTQLSGQNKETSRIFFHR